MWASPLVIGRLLKRLYHSSPPQGVKIRLGSVLAGGTLERIEVARHARLAHSKLQTYVPLHTIQT